MKRLSLVFIFLLSVTAFSFGDSVVTMDVGYMVAAVNFTNGSSVTQNSLGLNVLLATGDTLQFFVDATFGLMLSSEILMNGSPVAVFNMEAFDIRVAADLLAGLGLRFPLSDSFILMCGAGGHLYAGSLSNDFIKAEYITAGAGAFVSALVLFGADVGLNLGVKGAYDLAMLSGTGSSMSIFKNAIIFVPYIGFCVLF